MESGKRRQEGFVLITTLVVLLILTILSVGLYFRGAVSQQVSASGRDTTQAYYYAETALNYVAWALFYNPDHADPTVAAYNNDKELDGFNPSPLPANAATVGDRSELVADISNPGGQVKYFDNSASPGSRTVYFNGSAMNSITLSTLSPPMHLALEIAADGSITLDNDGDNNGTPDWAAIPNNGAVLWLTPVEDGADASNTLGADIQITTERTYQIGAYAIGYVGGKPLRMLRAIIGTAGFGPPIGLGSVSNGYQ